MSTLIVVAGVGFVVLILLMPEGKSVLGAVAEYIPAVRTPTIEYKTPTPTIKPPTPTTEKFKFPTFTLTPAFSVITPVFTPTPAATLTPTSTVILQTATPTVTRATITGTPGTATPIPTAGSGVFACIPQNTPQTAKVLDVIDSATIKVMINDLVYNVRYIGLAPAPETSPYYRAAIQRNAALVFTKEVQLIADTRDRDAAGFVMRYVLVNGIFVNYQLLREGYALYTNPDPNTACRDTLIAAEQSAKSDQIHLWFPTPVIPRP